MPKKLLSEKKDDADKPPVEVVKDEKKEVEETQIKPVEKEEKPKKVEKTEKADSSASSSSSSDQNINITIEIKKPPSDDSNPQDVVVEQSKPEVR